MNARRLLFVSFLVLLLLAPVPATAKAKRKNPYQCGGKWTAEATCTFRATGEGYGFSGWAAGPDLTYVTVRITRTTATGLERVIAVCAAPGITIAGCGQVGASSDDSYPVPRGTLLTCHVQGSPSGRYLCSG
jgi:hypothetical protein